MPKADRVLFAAFLRLTHRFRHEGLPLTGVVGNGVTCYQLDFAATLASAFHRPPPGLGFAEGAKLLTVLEGQLATLCGAEEHTREALSEWAALVADFQGRVSHPFSAAAAAEQGLLLLGRQAQGLTDPLRLDREEDELAGEGQVEDSMAAAADHAGGSKQRRDLAIEQLAADVRQEAPDLFHPDPVESSPGGSDRTSGSAAGRGAAQHERQQQQQQQQQRRRLQVLAEVLYRQHRLRYEPFEWVYDGLQPLLLPEVLKRRKGAPIVLAGLAAAVGRRLGLPLLPVPGESAEQAAASQQPSTAAAQQSELLSLELATRVATRTPATAPPPSSWVLLLLDPAWDGRLGTGAASGAGSHEDAGPSGGAAAGAVDCCYLDAASGALLDDAGVRAKYPTTQLNLDWRQRAVLIYWQELARTAVQAHQRRGESDLVAHWMYVLLALDPQAAEWGFMLRREP